MTSREPVAAAANPESLGSISSSPPPESMPTTGNATGGYGVILADPPWSWKSWSKKGEGRSASNHYDLMESSDLRSIPVADCAADDCVLFLWSLSSMLGDALQLLDAWDFAYKTVGFVWVKQNKQSSSLFMGLGYHTRQNAELCLLGTRGKPKRMSGGVHQIIMSPRREHSRKPDEIYTCIEQLYPGPYLEMFSRTSRPGWDAWGNEVGRWGA